MNRKDLSIYRKWLAQVIRKDTLTRQEIEQILDGQLELPENEIDGDLLQECLLYLYPEYEKGDIPGEKESRDKILQFWREVKNEKDYTRDNMGEARLSQHLRPAMVMLLVLLGVMLLGTAIAYALGYPIWNYVFHWGDEQVRIDIKIQAPVNSPEASVAINHFGLGKGDAFDEKLKELQIDPILPRLPEKYTLTAVDSSTGTTLSNVIGLYSAENIMLHISITKVYDANADVAEIVEKDSNEYEIIEMDRTSYYLFDNLDTSEVIWVSPPYIIQLGGDISKDELVSMIKTMDGGISND